MAKAETRALDSSLMIKKLTLLFFIFAVSLNSTYVYADQQIFTRDSFEQVKQQYKDKQWLIILWSVDCPACFKELALLEKIRKEKRHLPVVLINVDDSPEVNLERYKVLAQYKLADLQNLYFVEDQADQSRFMIDSKWYGELPRSYFIDKKGVFHGKSGLLDEALMIHWLL